MTLRGFAVFQGGQDGFQLLLDGERGFESDPILDAHERGLEAFRLNRLGEVVERVFAERRQWAVGAPFCGSWMA